MEDGKLDRIDGLLVALYGGVMGFDGYDSITAERMEMDKLEFGWSLYILQLRGMITGCVFQPPRPGRKEKLMGVIRDNLALTPEGFRRAEELAKEAHPEHWTTRSALAEGIKTILVNVGCGVMANYVSRLIS